MDSNEIQVREPITVDSLSKDRLPLQVGVLNGRTINIRKTHPSLYWVMMSNGVLSVLLGLNFMVLNPTFLIYDQSNHLWGSIFFILGLGRIVYLNWHRNLRLIRMIQALSFVYTMVIAIGTCQPFVDYQFYGGKPASLQLPLLYAGWAFLQLAVLVEPFINPWTARTDQ